MSNGIEIGSYVKKYQARTDCGFFHIVNGYEAQGDVARQSLISQKAAEHKTRLDIDADGALSKGERIADFDAHDANHDGKLRGDELKNYLYNNDLRVVYSPTCEWQSDIPSSKLDALTLMRSDFVEQQSSFVDQTWKPKYPIMASDPYADDFKRWENTYDNCTHPGDVGL